MLSPPMHGESPLGDPPPPRSPADSESQPEPKPTADSDAEAAPVASPQSTHSPESDGAMAPTEHDDLENAVAAIMSLLHTAPVDAQERPHPSATLDQENALTTTEAQAATAPAERCRTHFRPVDICIDRHIDVDTKYHGRLNFLNLLSLSASLPTSISVHLPHRATKWAAQWSFRGFWHDPGAVMYVAVELPQSDVTITPHVYSPATPYCPIQTQPQFPLVGSAYDVLDLSAYPDDHMLVSVWVSSVLPGTHSLGPFKFHLSLFPVPNDAGDANDANNAAHQQAN